MEWWLGSGLFSIPKLIFQRGFRQSGIRCINNGPKGIKIQKAKELKM